MYSRPFVIYKRAKLARKLGEVKFSPLEKEGRRGGGGGGDGGWCGGDRKQVVYLKEAKT